MTVLEFIKTHRSSFYQALQLNISLSDINYIGMIEDYNKLLKEGRKEPNVRALMCRRYNITAYKFRAIEKKLNKNYNVFDLESFAEAEESED